MRKKLTQYGLTAALAMGAAGILPANVYGAVNTYNLPGGNGKMIVISGGIGHYQNASGVNYWVQLFVK